MRWCDAKKNRGDREDTMKPDLFLIALAVIVIISFSMFVCKLEEDSNPPTINSKIDHAHNYSLGEVV